MRSLAAVLVVALFCVAATGAQQIVDPKDAKRFSIPVSVLSKTQNDYASGLVASDFEVYEGKKNIPIASFSLPSDPWVMGIVIDNSYSVSRKRLELVLQEIRGFIRRSSNNSRYILSTFKGNDVLTSRTLETVTGVEKLIDEYSAIKEVTNTRLFDAIEANLKSLVSVSPKKRILLVLTDGEDNASKIEYKKVEDLVLANNVVVYPLVLRQDEEPYAPRNMPSFGNARLKLLADLSGGVAYGLTKTKGGRTTFSLVTEEIENAYFIYVQLPVTTDKAKHRKLEVRLSSDAANRLGKVELWGKREVLF